MGQKWLGVVSVCFWWVTRNEQQKKRRNSQIRKVEHKLPEVRNMEKYGIVRKNVLGPEHYV